ncbi:putative F-box protein At3g52320 [Argentina anserina]|uniref:putative F-box protein At3g52320 n=1 Tax=Argentina anserina TaxID=57926 RepID=UPI0021768753|nr:putative F-box protein At3g52320 [Potentilla anserina]
MVNMWRKLLPQTNTERGDLNTKGTTIMDLPEDIIVDILLRLPVKSLCCIQCVSKTSFDIARTPEFATLYSLRLLDPATNSHIFTFPQLILYTKSFNQEYESLVTLQSVEYISGKNRLTKTRQSARVSKLCFKNCSYASYGQVDFVYCNLLCFYRGYELPRLLVNPLRGEVLELPGGNIGGSVNSWSGIGFDHVTSTYKIVTILPQANGNNHIIAQVLVFGTSSWRKILLVSPCDGMKIIFGTESKNTTYTSGHMHCLIYGNDGIRHIISFDFNKEELHEIPLPNDSLRLSYYSSDLTLLNLRGFLAIVNFGSRRRRKDHIEIWALKSYDKKKWELLHQIEINELNVDPDIINVNYAFANTCVEWEHGICFAKSDVCYFWDLRHLSVTMVKFPTFSSSMFSNSSWQNKRTIYRTSSIFGYTESLISLKSYGIVIEETKSKEGECHID